ncbi:MAG: regulatory protein RecX [Candidatus Ornithospirochaeta sp.]
MVDAYNRAITLLSRREHTEKELYIKLKEKGYREDDISTALSRLNKEGYLSEVRFAEMFVRSRLRKSPEGKPMIFMRLLEKGSPKDVASRILDEIWEEGSWKENLRKELSILEKKKSREYAEGKMRQKGFTLGEIRECREEEDEEQ